MDILVAILFSTAVLVVFASKRGARRGDGSSGAGDASTAGGFWIGGGDNSDSAGQHGHHGDGGSHGGGFDGGGGHSGH